MMDIENQILTDKVTTRRIIMNDKARKKIYDAYVLGNTTTVVKEIWKDKPGTLIRFVNGSYKDEEKTENFYLESIKNDSLWLSSPMEFNDPLDCYLNADFYPEMKKRFEQVKKTLFQGRADCIDEAELQLLEISKGMNEDYRKKNESFRSENFIACFSEKDKLTSLSMWGYYGNSHKGLVLEYDFESIYRMYKEYILPIFYKENYEIGGFEDTAEETRKFRLDVAYSKALEWSHEKEWRLLKTDESQSGKLGFNMAFIKPKRIYMGCMIESKLEEDVKNLCKQKKIDLFKMIRVAGSYSLTYEAIK